MSQCGGSAMQCGGMGDDTCTSRGVKGEEIMIMGELVLEVGSATAAERSGRIGDI